MASSALRPGAAALAPRQRRLNSRVWEYFSFCAASGPGEKDRAVCKRCGATLLANSKDGTSTLLRHIETRKCAKLAAAQQLQQQPDANQMQAGTSSVPLHATYDLDDGQAAKLDDDEDTMIRGHLSGF